MEYFASGRVRGIADNHRVITAEVRGTRPYRVRLWLDRGAVEYSCTCPVGEDGAFCKHAAAAGLAWLDGTRAGTPRRKAKGKATVTMEDVRSYLAAEDKSTLVELLMEEARTGDRLRQRLLLRAARRGPKGLDLSRYRLAIDNAVDTGGFVEYAEAYDFADGIVTAIDSLEELLSEGYAADVIGLAEYALERVEGAMESVDDSDGHMSGVLERLQDLHLRACKKAKPDPEALAERLFAWELRTHWDTFFGAVERYGGVLGQAGLAVYRRLAEAEWAKVPVLGPRARGQELRSSGRFRITRIMEALERESGDVEAVVAVKKRDLSSAYAYLQIAETYADADDHDSALEWAERGVKAFPDRTDSRLREFLADAYHRRKRHDDAMSLIWLEFTDSPDVERYKTLKRHGEKSHQWSSWRSKALDFLRHTIAEAKAAPRGRPMWPRPTDHSELVRVFLWENKVDAAWQEATTGGCASHLWMELAAKRARTHPEDALPIYQRQIEPTVNQKNDHAYRAAVGLLRQIRALMVRVRREDEFAPYLASVRAENKPKRNFMKLLDHAKWS